MIYLASPYTHDDPAVREKRFSLAAEAAAQLMAAGHHVFSPITHTHPIAKFGLPKDWGFWQAYDREFLEWCQELWVLKIPGWDKSKGIAAEIDVMRERGRPVKYLEEDANEIWRVVSST